MLRQDPDQPGRPAIHGKGQELLEGQHPGARLGNEGQSARPQAQQQERQGKPNTQRDEDQQCQGRGQSKSKTKRRGHEGRGAGRSHRHRQHAGEESPSPAAARGQSLTGGDGADFEQTGKIEADGEDQQRKTCHRDRGLKLKAPAHALPTGAQHLLNGPDARNRLFSERERQRHGAYQPALNIHRAAAHALHYARFGQRLAGQPCQDDRLLRPEVLQDPQYLYIKLFNAVSGENSLARSVLAGAHILQWKHGYFGKQTRC